MTTKAKPSFKLLLALVIVAAGSGLMVRGQSPQAVGTWAASGPIANGRAGAASTALDDGRTLISGGAIFRPLTSIQASPPGPSTNLYGTRPASLFTSSYRCPMKRLAE